MSDKYTWDNAGDLKQLSMDQTLIKDSRRQFFFHMVAHVFDNNNLSQEIFAIDTSGTVICSMGHGCKHMLAILPTLWRPGFMNHFIHIDYKQFVKSVLKQLHLGLCFLTLL